MTIIKPAVAGTLESSDCMVTVFPSESQGVTIEIDSVVLNRYGDAIRRVAEDTVKTLDVRQGIVKIQDMGALDCVIAARVETAIRRSRMEKRGAA